MAWGVCVWVTGGAIVRRWAVWDYLWDGGSIIEVRFHGSELSIQQHVSALRARRLFIDVNT